MYYDPYLYVVWLLLSLGILPGCGLFDEGNAVAAVARRVGGVQKVVKLFEYRG
jgi:hypothetical protein